MPADIDLARRAMKAAGWVAPGMLSACWRRTDDGVYWLRYDDGERLPSVADAATIGCLLALVRERWGMPGLGVHLDALGCGLWVFADPLAIPPALRRVAGATDAEALVAALEAAPTV